MNMALSQPTSECFVWKTVVVKYGENELTRVGQLAASQPEVVIGDRVVTAGTMVEIWAVSQDAGVYIWVPDGRRGWVPSITVRTMRANFGPLRSGRFNAERVPQHRFTDMADSWFWDNGRRITIPGGHQNVLGAVQRNLVWSYEVVDLFWAISFQAQEARRVRSLLSESQELWSQQRESFQLELAGLRDSLMAARDARQPLKDEIERLQTLLERAKTGAFSSELHAALVAALGDPSLTTSNTNPESAAQSALDLMAAREDAHRRAQQMIERLTNELRDHDAAATATTQSLLDRLKEKHEIQMKKLRDELAEAELRGDGTGPTPDVLAKFRALKDEISKLERKLRDHVCPVATRPTGLGWIFAPVPSWDLATYRPALDAENIILFGRSTWDVEAGMLWSCPSWFENRPVNWQGWWTIAVDSTSTPDLTIAIIGEFEGRSAHFFDRRLAPSPQGILIIEAGRAIAGPAREARMSLLTRNMQRNNATTLVFEGCSSLVLPGLLVQAHETGLRANMVYIDGSHNADDVMLDAEYAFRMLAPGGVMIFDDYDCSAWCHAEVVPGLSGGAVARGLHAFLALHGDEVRVLAYPVVKTNQVAVQKLWGAGTMIGTPGHEMPVGPSNIMLNVLASTPRLPFLPMPVPHASARVNILKNLATGGSLHVFVAAAKETGMIGLNLWQGSVFEAVVETNRNFIRPLHAFAHGVRRDLAWDATNDGRPAGVLTQVSRAGLHSIASVAGVVEASTRGVSGVIDWMARSI